MVDWGFLVYCVVCPSSEFKRVSRFIEYQVPQARTDRILWITTECHCYKGEVSSNSITLKLFVRFQPWASCQIRHIVGAHAPGMSGTFSPPPQVRDPDMHHGTCVTHVPWCMSGSLISGFLWSRRRGGNVPGIPGACASHNFTYLARGPLREHSHWLIHCMSCY